MTKETFASMIDCRDRRTGIAKDEELLAKNEGFIVVYGESDDLMEFRGVIDDEIGAYNGTTAIILKTNNGYKVLSESSIEEINEPLRDYDLDLISGLEIESKFDDDGYTWTMNVAHGMPVAYFDILEDGEKFCKGIVISVDDVKNYLAELK